MQADQDRAIVNFLINPVPHISKLRIEYKFIVLIIQSNAVIGLHFAILILKHFHSHFANVELRHIFELFRRQRSAVAANVISTLSTMVKLLLLIAVDCYFTLITEGIVLIFIVLRWFLKHFDKRVSFRALEYILVVILDASEHWR